MTGHSHTMGAIPARGATTITRRKPAIPAIIAPSNKAPAHRLFVQECFPEGFQKVQANHSTKQAGKPRCAGSWWPTPLTSRWSVMSSWNSGHTSHHKTTRWPKESGHTRPRSCWMLTKLEPARRLPIWWHGNLAALFSHFSTM